MSPFLRTLLFEQHPTVMLLLDASAGVIVDANNAAVRFYGWSRDQLVGKAVREINVSPEEEISSALRRSREDAETCFHFRHRLSSGEERFVEVHSGPVTVDGRSLLHSIVIDETPRVRAEAELRRRDRLHAMLLQTNKCLIRATNREMLFTDVCRIAVEHGGFRFAWVGVLDDSGRVVPVARAGADDDGYIDQVQATTHSADPRSDGPVGRAIITGAPVVMNNFLSDAAALPWRSKATRSEIHSVAAIPLREDATVVGAIVLYAQESDFFADEEVATLSQMGEDVSYGLSTLAEAVNRLAAEERAARWSSQLEQYLEGSPSVSYSIAISADEWRTDWVSPNAERILGYSMDEMRAHGWWISHVCESDRASALARSRAIPREGSARQEYRFLTADGSELWILDTARFEPDASGVGGRIHGTWTDVSDRHRALEELRASEERLRLALSAARQGLYDLDLTTGQAVVSPEYASMLEYDPDTFHETNVAWRERLHPEDRQLVTDALEAYLAGRVPEYRVEFRQRTRTGAWLWILSIGSVVHRDARGQPLRMLGTHTDITAMKRTEEQLALRARTAQALRELPALAAELSEPEFVQSTLDTIRLLTASEGAFLYFVDASAAMLELAYRSDQRPPEAPGESLHVRRPIADAGSWADAVSERRVVVCDSEASAHKPCGFAAAHHDCRRLISVPVLEEGTATLLVVAGGKPSPYTDTEVEAVQLLAEELWRLVQRGRADLVHQQGERFRRLLLENLAEGVVAADAEGRLTLFNRAARAWHGVDAETALDQGAWADRYQLFAEDCLTPLAPDQIPLVRAIRGEVVRDAMMSIMRPGQPPRLITANGGPLFDDDGRQVGAIIVMHDISAQRRAEAALRLRGEALEAAADAIVLTDRNGVVEWANPAFTSLTGFSLDEAAGNNPRTLLRSGVQSKDFYAELWRTILSGKVWRGELINKRRDGTLYPESLTITPVRDEAGDIKHFIAIKRDLTEDRALRANLVQAQKMESVGRLAGGVAHDFNNVLTVINGSSQLALEHLPLGAPAREEILEIRRAAERAAALTRQLLAFSRRQILRRHLIDVPHLIGDLSRMLQRLIGEDVTLQTELESSPRRVLADTGQLEQVVMNLVVNARDAMPKGGTLTISTCDVELDENAAAQYSDIAAGRYVRISVRDTGVGMDDAVRSRIFEPFFTTKVAGQGTGLGLSTVYGIIRQSGGDVQVESALGQGSAFHILLPYSGKDVEHTIADAPMKTSISKDASEGRLRGTVLVVDDEPILRKIAAKILARSGYTTLMAGSADEALAVFEGQGGAIDVLVTDVVMPGMSGPELAAMLTAQRPELKVIFASGYTDDTVLRHGVDSARVEFLGKPYTFEELIMRVETTLAS